MDVDGCEATNLTRIMIKFKYNISATLNLNRNV